MLEPLTVRRTALEKAKLVHQFQRDVEDENMWIDEKLQQAASTNYGNSQWINGGIAEGWVGG